MRDLSKLAQQVEHVCMMADMALDNLKPADDSEPRKFVAKIRKAVPPALRRMDKIQRGVHGVTQSVAEAREQLVEAVADIDPEIAAKFLEGEEIENAELVAAISRTCMRLISGVWQARTQH